MDIDLLIKIAGIGILVAVLYQILTKAGREDSSYDDYIGWNGYCFSNSSTRNKFFI